MNAEIIKNLTPSKLAEELDDARYQITFWRLATRLNVVALRNHRRFTIGTSARRIPGDGFAAGWQAMLETDIREGLTRYRRAQALLRILTMAPELQASRRRDIVPAQAAE